MQSVSVHQEETLSSQQQKQFLATGTIDLAILAERWYVWINVLNIQTLSCEHSFRRSH